MLSNSRITRARCGVCIFVCFSVYSTAFLSVFLSICVRVCVLIEGESERVREGGERE